MRNLPYPNRCRSALVTAALVVLTLAVPPLARAADPLSDAPADIPGAPWSGGSISSSVGREIVDRVWRIELTEGRVAIINVTGSSGAELGLYLFDEYARTVTSAAPIAQSAKAGGDQRLTAILPQGVYYVNVNGRNSDRAYGFTITLALLRDTTPPTLTLRPAPGGAAVNSGVARVQVLASDLLSGVKSMRFRVDGSTWGDWEAATIDSAVQIPTVRGPHRIEAQVTNGLDLASQVAATTVMFDDIPPTATRTTPRADGSSSAPRPTITYDFNEPIRPSSWYNGGLVVLSRSGSIVPGSFAYDAASRTGTWRPTEPLLLGAPYAVQLGGVVDLAGNAPAESSAWVLQYQLKTAIRVDPTPVRTTYQSLRTIIGTLSGIPVGSIVALDQRLPGGTWVEDSTYFTTDLPLRAKFNPIQSAEWRLRYDGDASHRATTSGTVSVKVAPKLTLSGAGGYVRVRKVGTTVQIRGSATPSMNQLTLVRYRCNSAFTGCVVAARIPMTADGAGAVTYAWKATRGNFIWKLKSAAGAGLEDATTGRLRFTVR